MRGIGLDNGNGGAEARRQAVLAVTALACVPFNMALMNSTFFPQFSGVFTYGRDLGILTAAAVCAAIAFVATNRPGLLRHRAFSLLAVALWTCGLAASYAGILLGSAVPLVLGVMVAQAGEAWLELQILLACSEVLAREKLVAGTALAVAVGIALGSAASLLPLWFALGLYLLTIPLGAILVWDIAGRCVQRISLAPAASDLSAMWPSSFLSPLNRFYLCIFGFAVATGYALRFGALEGRADTSPFAVLALLVAIPYCRLSKFERPFDSLLDFALLFTLGGFLLAPLSTFGLAAKTLLSVGDAFFQLVSYLALFSLAQRNSAAGLTVVTWGFFWTSMGTTVGANIGALAWTSIDSDVAYLASGMLAFCLLAFALFGLRGFSFDETIRGVQPVPESELGGEAAAPDLDAACERLAREHGLTARETDVLRLLARGRNNQHIQDELSLSRNTVKSHIKHVYTKLDVHSQQELIDLADEKG